jgi:hypothetical protein
MSWKSKNEKPKVGIFFADEVDEAVSNHGTKTLRMHKITDEILQASGESSKREVLRLCNKMYTK